MLSWMKEICDTFLDSLMALLPLSPFREIINSLDNLPYLGYINWFIPLSSMIKIGSTWLLAIGVYYAYSVIARWLKLIR